VRLLIAFALASLVVATAQAQDQERSLVNRLLRPDTTLQNDAQTKKFHADGRSVNKPATVASFYFENKTRSSTFGGTRTVSENQFSSRAFYGSKQTHDAGEKGVGSTAEYPVSSSSQPRDANDSNKSKPGRNYSDSGHPFLDKGKTQKSLDRKNPPMTIEQVRELLNKNK
jgi:hypothetical protein